MGYTTGGSAHHEATATTIFLLVETIWKENQHPLQTSLNVANVGPVNKHFPVQSSVHPNLQCAALKPFPIGGWSNQKFTTILALDANLWCWMRWWSCKQTCCSDAWHNSFIYSLKDVSSKNNSLPFHLNSGLPSATLCWYFFRRWVSQRFPANSGYWKSNIRKLREGSKLRSFVVVGNDMIGTRWNKVQKI